MLINGVFFGYTLEDKVRLTPKVPGRTAIPAGVYCVKVDVSPKFKKKLPHIMGVPGFKGVRIHGGNTAADSEGCPLVAKHRAEGKIWGSLSSELTQLISSSKKCVYIEIINTLEI